MNCASLEELVEDEYGPSYDLNAVLGVDENASHADVVNAYTMQSIRNMPDPDYTLTNEELFVIERKQNALRAAFTILSNKKHQFITGNHKRPTKKVRQNDPLHEEDSSSHIPLWNFKDHVPSSAESFRCSQMKELWTSLREVYCFFADCVQHCSRDETRSTCSADSSSKSKASTPHLHPVPEHLEVVDMLL